METVWDFLEEYWVALLACALFGALLWTNFNTPERKERRALRRRGREMEDARRAYLNQLLADLVTDGIDQWYLADKITKGERAGLYPWVGKRLGITDLYPKYLLKELLKREIERRLQTNHWDKHGRRKGVVIFPDSPGWKIKFQA